jgi:metal-responsive CopG/Arc/MetJ family transcriptional regulator
MTKKKDKKPERNGGTIVQSISINRDLLKKLDTFAGSRNLTRSAFITTLIHDYADKHSTPIQPKVKSEGRNI